MIHKKIHLNRYYPLKNDPVLEMTRPSMLDCPDKDQPLLKAVIVVPGGSYMFCSIRESDPVVSQFLADDYCCFTLWYTTNTPYPVPQLEAMAAVDYIKRHAKSLRVDTTRLVMAGFSAGGHLTASYGMLERDEKLHSMLNIEGRDTTVTALVLSYPVITMGEETHQDTMETITGKDESLRELLSVEKHVSKDYPPTFLWTTKEDGAVPYTNTVMMDEALTKAHVRHECVIYPHLWHGLSVARRIINLPSYDEYVKDFKEVATWVNKAKKFLNKVMKVK